LDSTECALVESQALHTNGGLEDDNAFIKAIATRPTWDAYKKASAVHGGRREDRDLKAEKYVARRDAFTAEKASDVEAEAAFKKATKDSEAAFAKKGEMDRAAKDAKEKAVKAKATLDAANQLISRTAEAKLQKLRAAAIEAHKAYMKHLPRDRHAGTSKAAKGPA